MKDYYGKDYSKLKNKKLWLFDMDGTIYLGNKLFDGTLDLLCNIVKNGGKYVFITNNSSKGIEDYLTKVSAMGVKADKDNFYTSVDASASLLKERFGNELIYAQGTQSFIDNLKAEGLNITTEYDENSKCVIVGFDTDLTAKKLTNTCKTLLKDIPYYATNPDWVCPTEFGYIPDCGSMCFGIEKATGKSPVFIGKPNSLMIEEVIKKFRVKKKDAVVIGDRIYTDIASGVNAGVDTVLVLSGETTISVCNESEIKPTFVIQNVKEINRIFE
ncbi:MAG: HAD-IIA family hydrolase [Christensenellaceae bacterium]